MSPAVVTYFIRELTENSANNQDLLENLDWFILPVANPDGYYYTKIDRLWRKTRYIHFSEQSSSCLHDIFCSSGLQMKIPCALALMPIVTGILRGVKKVQAATLAQTFIMDADHSLSPRLLPLKISFMPTRTTLGS